MNENLKDYEEITIFKNPILTIQTLIVILYEQIYKFFLFMKKHKTILLCIIIYFTLNFIEGIHLRYVSYSNKIIYFCLYWILLGVASSIGLGTGLHTFVLYLGPHIAKVTLAANECSYFPEMHPNKWEFKDFLPCTTPAIDNNSTSFWTILFNVQLEAILWGIGTAVGELPPYYMAKAAAEAGKTNEEIEELRKISTTKPSSLIDKVKGLIYQHLKKHGFITVLLCASV
jgi:hypothetical protein